MDCFKIKWLILLNFAALAIAKSDNSEGNAVMDIEDLESQREEFVDDDNGQKAPATEYIMANDIKGNAVMETEDQNSQQRNIIDDDNAQKGNCKIKYTNWSRDVRDSSKSLDNYKMDCGNSKISPKFNLESYRVVRYKYQCCDTGAVASHCSNREMQTAWKPVGDAKAADLSRISSACIGNSFMNAIRVEHSPDKSRFRFNYECCLMISEYPRWGK